MKAIEALTSVLCDPEGKCCISGSDDDRRLIDSALAELAQAAQQAPAGATEMENLQRTAVGWQERALRAERNWVVCRRWAIAGGAPVEKLGDDPDQPFHAASPAIEGESKWWPCPVAATGPTDGESNG